MKYECCAFDISADGICLIILKHWSYCGNVNHNVLKKPWIKFLDFSSWEVKVPRPSGGRAPTVCLHMILVYKSVKMLNQPADDILCHLERIWVQQVGNLLLAKWCVTN